MADTTPALPPPWQIVYDQWDTTRCVPERTDYLAEHPALAAALALAWAEDRKDFDVDDLRTALETIEAAHPDDEDIQDELADAIYDLESHTTGNCGCDTIDWEFTKDALSHELENLTGRWAILGTNSDPLGDTNDLDLDDLLERATGGRGLRALEATWDGTAVLTISISGTSSGCGSVVCHRLSAEAELTVDHIDAGGSDYGEDEPNCLVHRLGVDVVDFALHLFDNSEHLENTQWLAPVAEAVHAHWPMEQCQQDAAELLATSWSGSPADLLTSACAVGATVAA